ALEDLTVREWGEDGSLKGLTILLGRFARGAFAQRADRIPLLKEKHDRILANSGAIRGSHTWRETRATFNNFPKTDLFYARVSDLERGIRGIVAGWGDGGGGGGRGGDRGREPPGRRLRGALRGLLAPALLLPDRDGAAPRVRRRLRAGRARHLGRPRAVDSSRL